MFAHPNRSHSHFMVRDFFSGSLRGIRDNAPAAHIFQLEWDFAGNTGSYLVLEQHRQS